MKYFTQIVALIALIVASVALFTARNVSSQPVHVHKSPVANEKHTHSNVASHTHDSGEIPSPTQRFKFALSDQFPSTEGDPDNNVHEAITANGARLLQKNSVCFLAQIKGGYNDSSHTATVEKEGDGWRIHIIGSNIAARAGCLIFN